jgi:CPA1 family monovalent cation:H+ antiporter
MESITIGLVLLLAVVLSGTVSRFSPLPIPLPLIQIALGAAIAGVTGGGVKLEPDIFFLLFLPPLLFLDGWRIPKEGLLRDKGVILELALGLVVFTVLGVGLLIHWLIPAMPLAVAFALAAIVSPTDPIAVSAISARVPIPKRLMHILEGESLLNDASGLVCMRFAVAAALTGTFSVFNAVGTFLWLALGGIAIGVGVIFVVMKAKELVSRKIGEEPGGQILLSLLLPFGAYLLAEHLHCSGILAAVSAGITMSYIELRGKALATTRVGRGAVWDTVQFALNGAIFVLFGEQLPSIVSGAARIVTETGHLHPIWLLVYVIAINVALMALRFAWVWISLRFTLFRAARRGEVDQIADLVVGVRRRVLVQRGAADFADQFRIARAEADARLQLEGFVRAFRQADQQFFQHRRQLALAHQQRGRRGAEGGNDILAFQGSQTVIQGEIRRRGDNRLLVRHDLSFVGLGKAIL